MAAKQKDVDRKRLEIEYRAGIKSFRTLGNEFGLSGARVAQIADEEGWTRDLKERIKAATEVKLNTAILDVKLDTDKVERENQVVEAGSNLQVDVVLTQRKDIKRSRELGVKLFAELEAMTDSKELIAELGEIAYMKLSGEVGEKLADKIMDTFNKVTSFGGRVSNYKALADAIKTMVGLERQAYGLADNANGAADTPQVTEEMTVQETARRVAFVFASAMHRKES